jgi:hypothetical protein
LPTVLDKDFAQPPHGWPDEADGGVAWHADGVFHLAAWEHERFMALGAPLTGPLADAVVSATFRRAADLPVVGLG